MALEPPPPQHIFCCWTHSLRNAGFNNTMAEKPAAETRSLYQVVQDGIDAARSKIEDVRGTLKDFDAKQQASSAMESASTYLAATIDRAQEALGDLSRTTQTWKVSHFLFVAREVAMHTTIVGWAIFYRCTHSATCATCQLRTYLVFLCLFFHLRDFFTIPQVGSALYCLLGECNGGSCSCSEWCICASQ